MIHEQCRISRSYQCEAQHLTPGSDDSELGFPWPRVLRAIGASQEGQLRRGRHHRRRGLGHLAGVTELRRRRVRPRAEAVAGRVPGRRGVQRHVLQPEGHRRAVVPPRRQRQRRRPRGRVHVAEGRAQARHAHGVDGRRRAGAGRVPRRRAAGRRRGAGRRPARAAGGLQGVPGRGVPHTVQNAAPWVITVAAATIDRAFPTAISLGNSEKLVVISTSDLSSMPL
jgi:hypothetical protein